MPRRLADENKFKTSSMEKPPAKDYTQARGKKPNRSHRSSTDHTPVLGSGRGSDDVLRATRAAGSLSQLVVGQVELTHCRWLERLTMLKNEFLALGPAPVINMV